LGYNRVIIQYMKNTNEIYKLVDTAVVSLLAAGQATYLGSTGYPHALGYTQATLAHVLIELNEINPKAAERFVLRLENLTKEL
jgi:hypothetical protein